VAGEPPTTSSPLLTVSELGVDFALDTQLRTVVNGVSFHVDRGRILALVGESGSGKSVTALALLGLLPRNGRARGSALLTSGTAQGSSVELIDSAPETLRTIRGRRIGAIFQDPFTSFNPVRRVGAQIVETLAAHHIAKREAARILAQELLAQVGLEDPKRAFRSFPHQLSGGQVQRAMIAAAIACGPELLIADEPTTALDVTVQAGILDLLHQLRDQLGMAILLITHDMGVVADLADDVAVMQDGVLRESGSAEQVFGAPESDYTQALLRAVPRVDVAMRRTAPPAADLDAEPAADVRNVTITYGSSRRPFVAVDAVSLIVPAGQTVGLVGESGSGKTTLGKALGRLLPLRSGSVTVGGRDLASLRGRELRRTRAQIGFIFQNPNESLNPRARVGMIIAEPMQIHNKGSRTEQGRRVDELIELVHLPADATLRYPHELSGGQRQRVAIARALVLEPRLIVADEPTSALDVAIQESILALLIELQQSFGFGCLFISHDLAVVRQISQQVVVMRAGRVVERGRTDDVLARPSAPYTQTLLASVPVPDPVLQRARRAARGTALLQPARS
jgi:peptide/nickel transport system ATP-binding protein